MQHPQGCEPIGKRKERSNLNKPVLIKKTAGILSMTLNRPEKKNAINMEMYQLLGDGLIEAAKDEAVRAVLINAAGDSFCAGNDLKDFAAANQGNIELRDLPSIRFMKLLLECKKPVVAAVKGAAVGIGTTLLLHCDVVVSGKSTLFSLPFTKLGLVPEFGSTYILPAIGGRVPASQVLLLGESFGNEKAEQFGLVSTVCEDAEVDAKAMQKCRELVALPPKTLRDVKALIRTSRNPDKLDRVIETELKLFAQALKSEEHRQALAAFFAK